MKFEQLTIGGVEVSKFGTKEQPGGIFWCYGVTWWHDLALKHHLAASFETKFGTKHHLVVDCRFWDQLL